MLSTLCKAWDGSGMAEGCISEVEVKSITVRLAVLQYHSSYENKTKLQQGSLNVFHTLNYFVEMFT